MAAKGDEDNRPPEFGEVEKAKAIAWFRKAQAERDGRAYDYAIECFINGLNFWPEAVEEGHKALWSLAIQRQQAGGKKPGMMERLKRQAIGKDARQSMLNAELLLAKDPSNADLLDSVLKHAARAKLHEMVKFMAPKVFDSLRKDKKPDAARFKAYRQALVEVAERADAWGDHVTAGFCYERALESVEYLMSRSPADMALKDEQRDLSGKLTIIRGKYEQADTFRDSLLDAETQKRLHEAERVQQPDQALEQLVQAARREYEQAPTDPKRLNALVETLLRAERKKEEDEAIELLHQAYAQSSNYSFQARADEILLRQLARQTRALKEKAAHSGAAEDEQQYRLAALEERQTQLRVFAELVQHYPTDLRAKFRYGGALFAVGKYEEAIPVLQAAQHDPRSRARAQLLMGRAFFELGNYVEAIEVLRETVAQHEVSGDELGKQLLYWQARACEAAGRIEEAKAAYGKLLRIDYNYADGNARKRLEDLKRTVS